MAEELRALIDEAKRRRGASKPVPISRPRGELAGLLTVSYPKARMGDLVLDSGLERELQRVILEQRHAARILAHGLSPRRKLLLVGSPGTGEKHSPHRFLPGSWASLYFWFVWTD